MPKMSDASLGIKMVVEPGEYACVVYLPAADGATRELSGEVELVGGQLSPRGNLFGEVPLKVENGVAAFPQYYVYPLLKGRLRTNQELWLLDVSLRTWFRERVSFSARGALVGFPPVDGSDAFIKVRFQTEHLDRVIDFAPIAKAKVPKPTADKPLEWWVEERPSRYHKWVASDGTTLSVGFDARVRTADPYEMHVA